MIKEVHSLVTAGMEYVKYRYCNFDIRSLFNHPSLTGKYFKAGNITALKEQIHDIKELKA